MTHPIIQARYKQYDEFISTLKNSGAWNKYRDVNLTHAEKFRNFYMTTHTLKSYKNVNVPSSRLPFIASRKPIGQIREKLGRPLNPVYLTYSMNYKRQIDHFYKVLKGVHIVHVNEDISFIKNCLVQVANNLNVVTTVELHGALGLKHGFLPLTARYIKVWDERQKEKLIGWGLEAERIVVTGFEQRYASWEPLKKEIGSLKSNLFAQLWNQGKSKTLNAFKPLILIAPYTLSSYGDGGDAINRKTISMLQEAILACCEAQIIIKLHPGSLDKPYWDRWKEFHALPDNIVILRDFDSRRLVLASDLMIVHHSTMAIDGWQMGKSVAIVEDGMPSSVEEFEGVFEKVRDKKEVLDFINNSELRKMNLAKERLA